MSDGKWIYDGTGIDVPMNFQNFGTFIGLSTCIMSVMGCMDPGQITLTHQLQLMMDHVLMGMIVSKKGSHLNLAHHVIKCNQELTEHFKHYKLICSFRM
jgi:hypothetical protein